MARSAEFERIKALIRKPVEEKEEVKANDNPELDRSGDRPRSSALSAKSTKGDQ